jgi:uncharacterized protein (TIGR02246 family)
MKSRTSKPTSAAAVIRRAGEEWARNWNRRKLGKVVAAYAEDAVYLPPHHPAVHGRAAIRKYLKAPLDHGVTGLSFKVTYIRQEGDLAWDVGTYRMTVPTMDGRLRNDQGKYLTLWRRTRGGRWHIVADSWSSDLPA